MEEEIDSSQLPEILDSLKILLTHSPKNVTMSVNQLNNLERFIDLCRNGVIDRKIRSIRAEIASRIKIQEVYRAREAQKDSPFPVCFDDNIDRASENNESSDKSTIDHSFLQATSNKPRVDLFSFIDADQTYLMLKSEEFPLKYTLKNERLSYPLGVVFDEISRYWIICDRKTNKILLINVEELNVNVCEAEQLRNPTAVIVYGEGKTTAILCSEKQKRNYSIYIYNYTLEDPYIQPFASYREEMYDMKNHLRGLAKSIDCNLLSLETEAKKLRVFKKNVGGKGFRIQGASCPSFLATYRTTVAISDLGSNNVFICNFDDRDWKNVSFAMLRVLDSAPDIPLDALANQSGFKFVSGMQFDVNGHLLIGDAKGHTIKLYDKEYSFLHRISSDFPLPYMSSFHINMRGETVILDIHGTQKLIWVKMQATTEILPWIRPVPNNTRTSGRQPHYS